MPLENAPEHIKLAIDLISLIEDNNIDNQVAIAALSIALKDFQAKQNAPQTCERTSSSQEGKAP